MNALLRRNVLAILLAAGTAFLAQAEESPNFVTYDHHLEERGDLELAVSSTVGIPRQGQPAFVAPFVELEYGITNQWTSALYLEGLSRRHDSTIFTGWRFENRFRPLKGEHPINPVLYFEFEDINEASRMQKEVVGHAPIFDQPNSELRRLNARELETKLILGSTVGHWTISENFIAEKNLSADEGWEFGYAFGVAHPLKTLPSAQSCRICRKNIVLGTELYGGLGSTRQFGFRDTAHYLAPTLSLRVTDNSTFRVSPGIGLTHASEPVLLRLGFTYEIPDFGPRVAKLFAGRR
jgi:hypothetical protein